MVAKETAALVSVILWGIFGITSGIIGLAYNHFNLYLMVAIVAAITGNSAHLMALSFSKTGLSVKDETQK